MKILSEASASEKFFEASKILNDAVEHTLGPNGSNTAVLNNTGSYSIINDGKSIVESLTSMDAEIAPAMETIKQAAYETNRKAGDGTTSTIVLTHHLLKNTLKLSDDSSTRVILSKEILKLKEFLIDILHKTASKVTPEQYIDVAKVSLGSDKYAKLVADTFKFTEGVAVPLYIKSDQPDVTSENIAGVQLTKIKWCTRMILDVLNKSEFTNLKSLVLFQPVDRFEELTQLVRKSFQYEGFTLLFYNELSPSILENLLLNLSNNTCRIIPVSLSDYGKYLSDVMSDLADYTQTKVIDGANLKVSDVHNIEFGTITNAILTFDQIVVNNDACNEKTYKTFTTKSSIIKCGGSTKVDMEDNYMRIEDAVHSLDSAIKFGVVKGAGHTYSDLMLEFLGCREDEVNDDFMIAMLDSLSAIKKAVGLDEVPNDVIDSALVVEEVLKNSFTIAAQVLTTNKLIPNNIR